MRIVHLCLEAPYTDLWGYQENLLGKYHRKQDEYPQNILFYFPLDSIFHQKEMMRTWCSKKVRLRTSLKAIVL